MLTVTSGIRVQGKTMQKRPKGAPTKGAPHQGCSPPWVSVQTQRHLALGWIGYMLRSRASFVVKVLPRHCSSLFNWLLGKPTQKSLGRHLTNMLLPGVLNTAGNSKREVCGSLPHGRGTESSLDPMVPRLQGHISRDQGHLPQTRQQYRYYFTALFLRIN